MNWEEIKQCRLGGFIETAEYYMYKKYDNPNIVWSDEQKRQIKETIDCLRQFGGVCERVAKDLESVI